MDRHELIVIKIGSNVLTDDKGRLDQRSFKKIAQQIKKLKHKQIIIVSSGAIACGTEKLGISFVNRTIPQKQAAASVGQSLLMQYYAKFLHPLNVGQILLTADAIKNRDRAENVKNTINELLKMNAIPVINENDSVVVDEIKFGDNDMLSAQVATLVKAAKLIIMTDIDGLYTKNPRQYPGATLISEVKKVTSDIEKLAGGAGSHKGTGGMASKLKAAKVATESGIDMYIANGFHKNILIDIFNRRACCTHFGHE
jgi:glutamate 5-kinase